FDFPPAETETLVVASESGLDRDACGQLVRLAAKLRALKGQDLEEGVSTRLLVYCATLIADGMKTERAIEAALIEPLSDDADIKAGLRDIVQAIYG
ncbi:MAG TPA: AAA family ATPase, partial [Rhizobiales bacterium]|nr:AAA family ATPase [Hyphomicrobiales bacterium]